MRRAYASSPDGSLGLEPNVPDEELAEGALETELSRDQLAIRDAKDSEEDALEAGSEREKVPRRFAT